MTRINFGILPEQLIDQHLIAETAKELPRIPRKVRKLVNSSKPVNTHNYHFTLGTGHVCYFYDKLGYLKDRYNSLHQECLKRGFNVTYDDTLFLDDSYIHKYFKNTSESLKSAQIVKERIALRIRESKQVPRYYGKEIDKEFYIQNILKL